MARWGYQSGITKNKEHQVYNWIHRSIPIIRIWVTKKSTEHRRSSEYEEHGSQQELKLVSPQILALLPKARLDLRVGHLYCCGVRMVDRTGRERCRRSFCTPCHQDRFCQSHEGRRRYGSNWPECLHGRFECSCRRGFLLNYALSWACCNTTLKDCRVRR